MPPAGFNQEKPNGSEVSLLVQPQPSALYGSCSTTKGNAEDHQSSKMKEFNNFKDNLQLSWDSLFVQCQHGRLVDEILLNKCMDYITDLSRTPRTYRQAATLMGLQLVTSFKSVANTLAARRETTRMLLHVEKKKQTEGPRAESLNKRLSVTCNKLTVLEQMMRKVSEGLLVHCYRCYRYGEIDPDIWISCIQSLGVWILSYPPLFLQDSYLMYLGLTLNDRSAGVREASAHALRCLYEVDDNVPTLGLFTQRCCRHQLLPPEIMHAIGALKSNIYQPGAEDEHGTINLGYIWGDYICLGVDSKLTSGVTKRTTSVTYNKFFRLSRNVYLTMAGLRSGWEEMFRGLKSMFSDLPEEAKKVETAARLAYQFPLSADGPVSSLVVGWDTTTPNPQMFQVRCRKSMTTGAQAMAVGTGQKYINLDYLIDYDHMEVGHAFQDTMMLLTQACLLDPFCGGLVRGRILHRDSRPFPCYVNFIN